MIPTRRLLGLLFVGLVFATATPIVPGFIAWVIGFDLLVLAAAAFDVWRARQVRLTAKRELPPMMVQGQAAEMKLELQLDVPSGRIGTRLIELLDPLHPSLVRTEQSYRLEGRDLERLKVGAQQLTARLAPEARGLIELPALVARISGPWGLMRVQREILSAGRARVFPQVRWDGRVGELLLLAQRRQLGELKAKRAGVGGELYGLRKYTPGDPPSQIHWKATARRGELITREYALERGGRLVLLIDCARGMAGSAEVEQGFRVRNKVDYVVAAALALSRIALSRSDRVDVISFSDRIERRVSARGSRGARVLYERLFDLEARLTEPVYDLAAETVLNVRSGRCVVVLFTSVVDLASAEALSSALKRLRSRHRVLLINLEDPVLAQLAFQAPEDAPLAYAKVSALDIVLRNRDLAHRMKRAGIWTASTSADRLALETLEGYLAAAAVG